MWTVYMHENLTNGKRYIGATKTSLARECKHGEGYRPKNPNSTSLLYEDIKKYGWDGFSHKVIMRNLTESEAWHLRSKMIRRLGTDIQSGKGYNTIR